MLRNFDNFQRQHFSFRDELQMAAAGGGGGGGEGVGHHHHHRGPHVPMQGNPMTSMMMPPAQGNFNGGGLSGGRYFNTPPLLPPGGPMMDPSEFGGNAFNQVGGPAAAAYERTSFVGGDGYGGGPGGRRGWAPPPSYASY